VWHVGNQRGTYCRQQAVAATDLLFHRDDLKGRGIAGFELPCGAKIESLVTEDLVIIRIL
jgi:hypothetical protein